MNYNNYIISTKSSGLPFNIMRVIILSNIASKLKRRLIVLGKPGHIPFLKKFALPNTIFIPYIDGHTDQYNNYKRRHSLQLMYDLKYISFIKKTYIDAILSTRIDDYKFICGNAYDIEDTEKKMLVVDYNDGNFDTAIINGLNYKTPLKITGNYLHDGNINTINLKINDPDNKRIYEFWDEMLNVLTKRFQNIFIISGNNDIKKHFGRKYSLMYKICKTECDYSYVRGNNIVRGAPSEVFDDLINCSLTNYIPFIWLRKEYPEIMARYFDLNFVTQKIEKFDILVNWLKRNIKYEEL